MEVRVEPAPGLADFAFQLVEQQGRTDEPEIVQRPDRETLPKLGSPPPRRFELPIEERAVNDSAKPLSFLGQHSDLFLDRELTPA